DGPAPGTTARVLETLKRECARASFFLLGRNALAYPQLARRALSEGHTVTVSSVCRGRRSFAVPALPPRRPCSIDWNGAASWLSAPIFGKAPGPGCRRRSS